MTGLSYPANAHVLSFYYPPPRETSTFYEQIKVPSVVPVGNGFLFSADHV